MMDLPSHPEKILIRSTNWIGDAVMTTPAIRTIRENFPESEIVLLAYPWVSDIFRYSPRIDRILTYDKKGRHKGIPGMLRLAAELREEHFDSAILLQNAFEAAFITWRAGIPVRAGYNTDGRGFLLTHKVHKPLEIVKKHEVFYYQRIMIGLGMQPGPNELELFIPGEEIETIRERVNNIANFTLGRQPLIGFNPGAAFGPAKRWPPEKYGELAQLICKNTDAVIVLFGSNADRETCSELIANSGTAAPRILNLAGATTLMEAMALIGECDVFVTNDSGLMHVAAALHTPMVAIFGSTDHIRTGPYTDNAIIIRKALPCSPCKKKNCPLKHFHCMRLITSDEVYDAVASQLEAHK